MDEMIESTGTIEDAIRDLLNGDDEAARAYLKESFLSEAILAACFTPGAMPDWPRRRNWPRGSASNSRQSPALSVSFPAE